MNCKAHGWRSRGRRPLECPGCVVQWADSPVGQKVALGLALRIIRAWPWQEMVLNQIANCPDYGVKYAIQTAQGWQLP